MIKSVGVQEAKTHLSGLLAEEVARLVPPRSDGRRLGLDRGRLVVPDDFDAPLADDLLDRFGA